MFVLNAYFCRELRFVAILRSKLRFLLRNTGVDSDFIQNFCGNNWRLGALLGMLTSPTPLKYPGSISKYTEAIGKVYLDTNEGYLC